MTRPRRRLVAVGVVLTTIAGLGIAHAATLPVSSQRLTVQDLAQGATTTCTLAGATDTHIRQNSANSNYGSTTTLRVRSVGSSNWRALVRFTLTSCAIPATATVQSATLTLTTTDAATTARTYDAYRNLATWTETGVTYNTRPSTAAAATDASTTPTVDGTAMSWDLGPDVAAYVAGSATNYGWTVRDASEGSGATIENQFASDENGSTAIRPSLVVKWTP